MAGLKGIEGKLKRDAQAMGLSFDRIIFKRVSPDEINEVAAFGLPNRFIHWIFGSAYKSIDFDDRAQLGHALELVLNSVPVVARLSARNSDLENKIIIAHVLGHADFFYNNGIFKKTNKQMPTIAANNAHTIEQLQRRYGKKKIEDYLTALMAIAKASLNTIQFPDKKKESLFYTLYDLAPKETYEKSLFEMIKQESEYFDVVFRTQCINEGWAHFCDAELLRQDFSLDEWYEYSKQSSRLPAPYQVGYALFASLKKKYGMEKCLEVRKYYEDISFIQEFLTQEIVRNLEIGFKKDGKFIPAKVGTVIKQFVEEKQYLNIPQLIVENKPKQGSKLYLTYHEEENKKISENRTGLYLKEVQRLWKDQVQLTIYDRDESPVKILTIDEHGNIEKNERKKK